MDILQEVGECSTTALPPPEAMWGGHARKKRENRRQNQRGRGGSVQGGGAKGARPRVVIKEARGTVERAAFCSARASCQKELLAGNKNNERGEANSVSRCQHSFAWQAVGRWVGCGEQRGVWEGRVHAGAFAAGRPVMNTSKQYSVQRRLQWAAGGSMGGGEMRGRRLGSHASPREARQSKRTELGVDGSGHADDDMGAWGEGAVSTNWGSDDRL